MAWFAAIFTAVGACAAVLEATHVFDHPSKSVSAQFAGSHWSGSNVALGDGAVQIMFAPKVESGVVGNVETPICDVDMVYVSGTNTTLAVTLQSGGGGCPVLPDGTRIDFAIAGDELHFHVSVPEGDAPSFDGVASRF